MNKNPEGRPCPEPKPPFPSFIDSLGRTQCTRWWHGPLPGVDAQGGSRSGGADQVATAALSSKATLRWSGASEWRWPPGVLRHISSVAARWETRCPYSRNLIPSYYLLHLGNKLGSRWWLRGPVRQNPEPNRTLNLALDANDRFSANTGCLGIV
jgi:hypothetical protein